MKKLLVIFLFILSITSFSDVYRVKDLKTAYKVYSNENLKNDLYNKILNFYINVDLFNEKEKSEAKSLLIKELKINRAMTTETLGITNDMINDVITKNKNLLYEFRMLYAANINRESYSSYLVSYGNLHIKNELLNYSFAKDPSNILSFIKITENMPYKTRNMIETIMLILEATNISFFDNEIINILIRDKEYKSLQAFISFMKTQKHNNLYALNKAIYYDLKHKNDPNAVYYLKKAIQNTNEYVNFFDIKSLVKTYIDNYKNDKEYKEFITNYGVLYYTYSDGTIDNKKKAELLDFKN